MVDQEKIQQAVRLLLEGMGEDVEREGLLETPQRVGRMYAEICRGMDESASEHLSTTFSIDSDDMVVERDIQFYSLCEHHLLPFYGKVHLAYIPNGRVTGLSKLARTVEVFSRRLQLQERLTSQIADALMDDLGAKVRVRRRDLARFQVRSLAQNLFPAPVRLLALAPFRLRAAHLRRALLS